MKKAIIGAVILIAVIIIYGLYLSDFGKRCQWKVLNGSFGCAIEEWMPIQQPGTTTN